MHCESGDYAAGCVALQSHSHTEFEAVRPVQIMSPHVESDKHLPRLEWRKMITGSYTLEASSHVFGQTGLLESIYSPCEMEGEVVIMQILHEVD